MIDIAVTVPATRRPEILKTTLNSFFTKGFSKSGSCRLRFFVNIDPVGPSTSDEVEKEIKQYTDHILFFNPDEANFSEAVGRIWHAAVNHYVPDFVFHLEDDWELRNELNFDNLIRIFCKYPRLASLRLNAFISGDAFTKNWNLRIPWNGVFYEYPDNLKQFCITGHPTLYRPQIVSAMLDGFDTKKNPEKQHYPRLKEFFDQYTWGVYGLPGTGPVVRDIGRSWMVKNGYRKKGNKAHFIEWVKIDGGENV